MEPSTLMRGFLKQSSGEFQTHTIITLRPMAPSEIQKQ